MSGTCILKIMQTKQKNMEKLCFPLDDDNEAEFKNYLIQLKLLSTIQMEDHRATPEYRTVIALIPPSVKNISLLGRKWGRYEKLSFTDGKVIKTNKKKPITIISINNNK